MIRSLLPRSIRNRVLVGAVLILGLLLASMAAIARQYSTRAADEAFDRVLSAATLAIADGLRLEEGFLTIDMPQSAFEMLGAAGDTRVFYRVATPNGAFLTGYYDLAFEDREQAGPTVAIRDMTYRGETVRLATLGRYIAAGDVADWAVVRLAETREARNALAAELFRNILLPVGVAAALALALVWIGVTRAFTPFGLLREELARRSPSDLTPLEGRFPREVGPVVLALNDFMARLSASLKATRMVVADAAHQLRTPIAALRAQAELAAAETDPRELRRRIDRIHANAVIAGQLQDQLLASASISNRLEAHPREPVDLRDVVHEIIERLDDDQLSRIDLKLPGARASRYRLAPRVMGERVALREMLRNLIDNAFSYAPSGLITIRLAPDLAAGLWTLTVADRGPGVPEAERELVMERFRRGAAATATAGSGLGLSIARDVARGHGGDLDLAETPGGGLTARIRLPGRELRPRRAARGADPQAAAAAASRAALPLVALLALALWAGPPTASAQDMRLPALAEPAEAPLRIVSDGEHETLATLARAFQRQNPRVPIEYRGMITGLLQRAIWTSAVSGDSPDLSISGAQDVHVKLANEGHARRVALGPALRGPASSRWRNELIGFTQERMVFAYNPATLPAAEMPRSRLRMAQLLETSAERFRSRVVIYDIGSSGVGYLLAAHDAAVSPLTWRLFRALGQVDAILADSSLDMLGALERSEALIAYGVTASTGVYERARASRLAIVQTEDYAVVTTRTAMIPRAARNHQAAERFIAFLLSPEAQELLGEAALIPAGAEEPRLSTVPLSPVPLGAAALIHSDQRRKERFVDTWIQLVLRP